MVQTNSQSRKSVVILDTHPVTIEGMRALLADCADLKYGGAVTTLPAGIELVGSVRPAVVVIDRAFGMQPLMDWLPCLRASKSAAVVWGSGIGNGDALRLVQSGARGVVQKTSDLDVLMSCLRTAADGGTWMSDTILQPVEETRNRSNLTTREQEVTELVERGMRNKEIAHSLGIQTGTVKIHLKHIFEKTGCRGRYGLALSGLREKGHFTHVVM